MPKAKDTEYSNRLSATAERTEYPNNIAVAEKAEHANEKTEHKDNTAVAEKAEHTDEKAEHKTQYPAENRDNSYLAANQHMVKFSDELRGINEQAALSFDRRKNPAEYDLKEKEEMLEAVTEAFNATSWNSANERRLAADDIAQNLYHPMYPRVEIAEAAVQHKLPEEFIQELKQEKIEYFENKPDETGAEALNFTVKDIETAQRMVEQSGGKFHIVSTRNLDHYRDQFADALYSSDRNESAAGQMESSLDDAIRLYNGDVSHVRRWDETLDATATFSEQEAEHEGKSEQQQTEGQLEPTDRELTAFSNLQSMDEYKLDNSIRDMLNEKLSHTQEYLTELQVNQHPDANAATQVHEALHELSYEGIEKSVEKGNEESFAEFIRHIEGCDEQLALEMRERNGFIKGENYVQPKAPEKVDNVPPSIDLIKSYSEEVRETMNEHRHELPELNYDITDKLLEKLDIEIQMVEEWEAPLHAEGYDASNAAHTTYNRHDIEKMTNALEYITRAEDPAFWKLGEMSVMERDSEIQRIAESRAAHAISDYLETNGDPETQERTLLALNAVKGTDETDPHQTVRLTDAVNHQNHELYKEMMGDIDAATREYAEILNSKIERLGVNEKPEHPVHFAELNPGEEFDEKKQLYLEQATEFANHYKQLIDGAQFDNCMVLYLAEDLLRDYQTRLETAAEYQEGSDEDFRQLDVEAETMESLLQERQAPRE